ncbi:SNF2 DOMAIN-CONTAINING PROTEIN CLASSY 2-RELATED [Salix koriyanagi]|uniref:SNF2 DOMAIN-CONTAINING PROTEIN CLASSY 2-RELATED n=1 Tax=Salix koriyanagi TaxID=2511006 RepID=A0A9Q0Q7A9_9ROSI|nr:SNF2 DOMAIN-CONTAINING PROTEIN CLASSY 2-RELATED [Salix koriyanagi]
MQFSFYPHGEVILLEKGKIALWVSAMDFLLEKTREREILDEGHTPRNKQSLVWKALSKMRSLPNTIESFIKKHGLKENESRCNWFSLTNPLGKVIDDGMEGARLKEVRKMIRTLVHVQGTILQEKLPGLRESLISSVSVHPSLLKKSSETEELQVDWHELKRLQKNPNASVKTHFLMELNHLSKSRNEKVLVFCQYLPPLNLICKQLKSQLRWAKGKKVLYMDGALTTSINVNHFNDPRKTQAISSAYKLGQDEIMYSYHLVTSGEEEKYCRQARKERLSELVFYSADNAGNEKKNSSDISDDSKDRGLEALVEHESLKCMFKRIIYEPEDSSLVKCISFDRSIKSFLLIFC